MIRRLDAPDSATSISTSAPSGWLLERVPSPLGEMLVVTDTEGYLRALDWTDHEDNMHRLMRRHYRGQLPALHETREVSAATRAVLAYFEGDMSALDTIRTATGGTDFQRRVWSALRQIPVGQTVSYLALATLVGNPAAVRAVGLANGANPISIVVPCHRVIGSNALLTGYGGGLHRKQWLLEHENAWPAGPCAPSGAHTARLPGF